MSIAYTDEGVLLRIIILCLGLQELLLYISPNAITPIPRLHIGFGCVFLIICLKMTIFACIGVWVFIGKSSNNYYYHEEPINKRITESESEEEFLSYRYQ